MQTRRQVQAAGPAWVWGPEDRSDVETEIPNHACQNQIDRTKTYPENVIRLAACLSDFVLNENPHS